MFIIQCYSCEELESNAKCSLFGCVCVCFFINVKNAHVCYINCLRVHPRFGVWIRLGMAKLHAILVHFDSDIAF